MRGAGHRILVDPEARRKKPRHKIDAVSGRRHDDAVIGQSGNLAKFRIEHLHIFLIRKDQ